MSQTLETNSPNVAIAGGIRFIADFFAKDVAATTDAKLTESPGGEARAPYAFIAEVVGFNYAVASILNGEEMPSQTDEEKAAFAESMKSKDAAVAAIRESSEVAAKAVEGFNPADWNKDIIAPWGMPSTNMQIAQFVSLHTMYHDGQLNYVQTMYGDCEVHWM